jgi:hypothetical protein
MVIYFYFFTNIQNCPDTPFPRNKDVQMLNYMSVDNAITPTCLVGCLFVRLSIHLSICASVHLPNYPYVQQSLFQEFICLLVLLSICLSVYLSSCSSVYLSICSTIHMFIWLFFINLFVHTYDSSHIPQPICRSVQLSIGPTVPLSMSVCPYV